MTFEDKILAYLDGSLDETSRAELLHTLSVSPEKRALLDEHLRLHELMSFGHKPLNVPLVAERALANRIAILGQQMPHLVDEVTAFGGAGWMAGALQAVRTVFSISAVRFVAGSLAIGAIIWLAGSRNNDVGSIAINNRIRNAAPEQGKTSAALATIDNLPIGDTQTAEQNKSSVRHERSTSNHIRSAHSPLPSVSAGVIADATSNSDSENGLAISTHAKTNGLIAQGEVPVSQDHATTSNPVVNTNSADVGASNAAQMSDDHSSELVASISMLPLVRRDEVPSYTLDDLANAESDLAHRPIGYQTEETSSLSGKFSAWVGYGIQQSYGATLAGDALSGSAMASSPAMGLNYRLSDLFTVGIESGAGNYSRIESHVKALAVADQPGVYHVQYTADIISQSTRWLRGTFGLNLFSIQNLHVAANLGGGLTLTNGSSPMVSASAIASYDLFEKVGLNAQFSYSGAWLKPLAAADWRTEVANGSNAVGIVSDPVASHTLLTPAIDLFIGLRYTF